MAMGGDGIAGDGEESGWELPDWLLPALKSWTVRITGIVLVVGFVVGGLYLSLKAFGVVATILYAFLFLFGMAGIPTIVGLFAPSFPNSLRKAFGKLHWVLGALAYGTTYLVQRKTEWELRPGTRNRVHVDGGWHRIEGGQENLSVLGWQPFGVLRYKTDQTMLDKRVDQKSKKQRPTASDGGQATVKRGGFEQITEPLKTGIDEWVVDLKRVHAEGLGRTGDTDIIETAEEVAQRKENESGRVNGYEPIIGAVVGIVLGVATAYVMLGGV
jgi:hypothetical protein